MLDCSDFYKLKDEKSLKLKTLIINSSFINNYAS